MSAVRKTASLHPKTVTKISTGEVKKAPKMRTQKRTPNSRVKHTVWHDGVDPLIVAWVRENHIHWTRIEVESPTSIIVRAPKH